MKLWSTVGDASQEPRLIAIPAMHAEYLPAGRVIITAANLAVGGCLMAVLMYCRGQCPWCELRAGPGIGGRHG